MRTAYVVEAIVFYVLLAIFTVTVAGSIMSDAKRVAIHDFVSGRQASLSESSRGIQTLIRSVKGYTEYIANLPEVKQMNLPETGERFLLLYSSLSGIVASITRMDSTGVIRVTIPYSGYEGQSIAHQEHVKQLLKKRKPVTGGPLRVVQGFDAIVVHIPVFTDDSIFSGSVGTVVMFDSLKTHFIEPLMKSKDETIWLANSKGSILFHPKEPVGKHLGDIYSMVSDTALIHFMAKFPQAGSGSFSYTDQDGQDRVLLWQVIDIGFEKWILALDSNKQLALVNISSLKKKLLAAEIFILLSAFLAVYAIATIAERRSKVEQQNRFLKLVNYHREKLDFVYHLAQELLTTDMQNDVTPKIVEAAKYICEVPFCMIWTFDNNEGKLVPGHFIVGDSRIADELRSSGVDIAQIQLGTRLGEIDILKLSGHIIVSISDISNVNPAWAVLSHILRSLHSFTHVVIIPLFLRERFFACIILPTKAETAAQSEMIESFRLSISQVLYIRSILSQLLNNDRIHQDIINTVDKAIFLIDSNFTILSASPMFYRVFEVNTEAVGRNLFEVVKFMRDMHKEQVYYEVIKTKSSIETEETYLSKDGRRRFTRTKIIPIQADGGIVRTILTIVDDVSEFRLMEEQLKHTADELALRNRQLQRLAITDELTQLRNFRHFNEQLPIFISRSRAEKKPLALLSLDIDGFKGYNDTYGHQAGDRLLAEFGEILRSFLRTGDLAARYGGDEFVVILWDAALPEAQDVAQRLCSRVSETAFMGAHGVRREHITVSIGLAMLTDDIPDAEELFRRADQALYQSKASGKNRATVFQNISNA